MLKALFIRFLREGLIAGASAALLSIGADVKMGDPNWSELFFWLQKLAIVFFVGMISGLLSAISKWTRWNPDAIPYGEEIK